MKRITLLVLLLLNFLYASSNIAELSIEHLGFEKGLSQITVFSLYQDENGGIWIGTNDGLMHYRGNTVENLSTSRPKMDLASGIVTSICGDGKGHVYALINNKIVEYDLKKEDLHFLSLPKDLMNKRITAIAKGLNGMWIGMSNGIYQYQNGNTIRYTFLSNPNTIISALCETSKSKLFVGTSDMGAFIIDNAQKEFHVLPQCGTVNSITEDSKKNIWICSNENGLYKIDNQLNVKLFTVGGDPTQKISSNVVRSVCEDNNDNLWIGTFSGLDKMNLSTSQIEHYGLSSDQRHSLSSNSIRCITKDKQGTIWLGTYYGGINYFNPEPEIFKFYEFKKTQSDFSYPIIGKIVEDKRGDYWICSDGKGLIYFNKAKDAYFYFSTTNSAISGNNIKSIYYDQLHDGLWIGTYRNGINWLDIASKRFTHFKIGAPNSTISNELQETVQSIVPYNDKLFLGTLFGIFSFDIKSGIATHILLSNSIRDMLIEGNYLWIAGQDGLTKFDLVSNKILKVYIQNTQQTNNLPKNRITKLYLDRKKRLWLSTDGSGLAVLDKKTDKFILYNTYSCGMESDNVSCLSESKYGYILAGTNKGFSRIDVERNKSYNYSSKNGFPILSMSYGSITASRDGQLLMGGIDGMAIFKEDALTNSGKDFNMKFTGLWVNNRKVLPDDETGILKQALPYIQEIEFKYDQKIIAFEFATDNFIKANQPNFQYKLEGFDKQWLEFDQKNPITYMNLPSGTYTLKVRSLLQQAADDKGGIELKIIVLPPIYARWYAYLLYIILITGIAAWIIRFYQSRLILRTSLQYERREKEQNEIVNQSKLRFFTNISHEFRTSLTLSIVSIEKLGRNRNEVPQEMQKKHLTIQRNASILLRLINQLVDFRKFEQSKMILNVSQENIVAFLENISSSFSDLVLNKKIRFNFTHSASEIMAWIDADKIEKNIYNFLSNAFKFTPGGGQIELDVDEDNDFIKISVKDTGVGIPEDSQHHIFELFYQSKRNKQNSSGGTGIGLSFSKGFAELHHGDIRFTSCEGEGCCFVVTLKKGFSHFETSELQGHQPISESMDRPLLSHLGELKMDDVAAPVRVAGHKSTILIVEDNLET